MFDIDAALASNAWPFKEAEALLKRVENTPPKKGFVLFETGYGPSGLPHIGTFGEVFRTTMVRQAFMRLSDIPTKLYAFSDDMDGLRKVPDNIPNQAMVAEHLGKPLTQIPDPFATHESFGAHMNGRLQQFLDRFGFDYDFKSATDCYQSGMFDTTLRQLLRQYDAVMRVMLPTLGKERQATYSPFLPLCPKTGIVLQVPLERMDVEAATVTYLDPHDGEEMTVSALGGSCKLQWKPDWGMRWAALGVDYEMYGKDLIPSAQLSEKICEILGGTKPEQYFYELFLDADGAKISKSKGNGISLEEWLNYGTEESLSLYMFNSPRKAKRLHFDVIPKAVDEYLTHTQKAAEQEPQKRYANPSWHLHAGQLPAHDVPVSFGLLLNLASACNPQDASVLWGFISRYAPGASPQTHPYLATLVELAMQYYRDIVAPEKQYRTPTDTEKNALLGLKTALLALPEESDAETLQTEVFSVGKAHEYENLRQWFAALYETLLGQSQGPRMGSFIALYGVQETCALIDTALER